VNRFDADGRWHLRIIIFHCFALLSNIKLR
jgi:hypothetical protein